MSTFLEKDLFINEVIVSNFYSFCKKRYDLDIAEYEKKYEQQNVYPAFFADVLTYKIIPEMQSAISVLLFGKEDVIDFDKRAKGAQSRIRKLVSKSTPNFIKKRLEKAIQISPFIAYPFLPYKLLTSSKTLELLNAAYLLFPKSDVSFFAIKASEHFIKFSEEAAKLSIILFRELVIGKNYPSALFNLESASPISTMTGFASFLDGSFYESYLVKSVEQSFSNAGVSGVTVLNLLAHYNNMKGNPGTFNTTPITFPLFGTRVTFTTSKSKVTNYVPSVPGTPVTPVTPVDPVTPVTPVDPVTPVTPVDPVDPVTPVTPDLTVRQTIIRNAGSLMDHVSQVTEEYEKYKQYLESKDPFYNKIFNSFADISSAVALIKIYFSYILVVYAEKVKLLGDIGEDDLANGKQAIREELLNMISARQPHGASWMAQEFFGELAQWELNGNKIENILPVQVQGDDRNVSLQKAEMSLLIYEIISADVMDYVYFKNGSDSPNKFSSSMAEIINQYSDPNYVSDSETDNQIIAQIKYWQELLTRKFGEPGNVRSVAREVPMVLEYVSRIVGEDQALAVSEEFSRREFGRYSYLISDGILPTNQFIKNYFQRFEGPSAPPDSGNSGTLVELSTFVQHLIDDQANAGIVGRIIASAYSILMQRIFTNNVNAGVLEFEGVSVEVTNPEAMVTQMAALKEKVLSLLISIPESSPMYANFSLIKQKLMDDSNNYQELYDLVTDTARNVYKIGSNDISVAATAVFTNVLGLNVIGNQMAGVDPTSNALDISRILLDRPITSMDGLDSAEVVSSFAPVLDFKNSTNV